MRVISGIAGGRRLKAVHGSRTRPITDRVKEAVFSIIASELEGASFLDLFAGTGGVGIEALSRGARTATFVERDPRAVAVIKANLQATGLTEQAIVVQDDVFHYLSATREIFDIVYVAPPQYQGLWKRTLLALDATASPAGDLVIVQIYPKEFESVGLVHFALEDSRRYGSTQVCFFRRQIEA